MGKMESRLEELSKELSIVVPIYKISSRSDNFVGWISNPLIKFAEIILVHDLSDGENCDFLRGYSSKHSNITLLEESCGSPGKSRNIGLEIASRKWVVFWDCDDYPHIQEFLELLENTIESNATHGVGSFNVIESNTGNLLAEFTNDQVKIESNIANWIVAPGLWRWIFTRADIGELRFKTLPIGEDVLFLVELNAIDNILCLSDKVTYSYYVGNTIQQSSEIDNNMRLRAFEAINEAAANCKPLTQKFGMVFSSRLRIGMLMVDNTQNKIWNFIKILRSVARILSLSNGSFQSMRLFLKRHNFQSHLIKKSKVSVYMAGGLGNQLFQLSFGIYISQGNKLQLVGASKEISLLVEKFNSSLSDSNDDSSILLRKNIGYVESKLRNFLLSKRQVYSQNRLNESLHKLLTLLFSKVLKRIAGVNTIYVAPGVGFNEGEDIFSSTSFGCVGYHQSFLYVEPSLEMIRELLGLSLQGSSQFFELMDLAKQKQIMAVQIRLGDYTDKSNHQFGVVTRDYLSRSIDFIGSLKKYDEIWVFSDDSSLAKGIFPEQIHPVRWMPDNTFGSLETLLLMSQASSFVISNSTFGWWGATLSIAKDKPVVCPNPWFKEMPDPILIVPESWYRISNPF
jgi:glycosyltransferase involved in cell wall biosynthesis